MKKRNFKSLKIRKKTVSILNETKTSKIKGGDYTYPFNSCYKCQFN